MITINIDQGFVNVESWGDVESLPGFVPDLNPIAHKLEAIIGRYLLKEKIKCGLSNCHTLHGKGYIVKTKEGSITNIGKDCGKAYFGVDFEDLSKKFERDFTEKENRERLCSFSFQIEELERTVDDLRTKERGANWVYMKTRPLVTVGSGCPEIIIRRISAMIKSGTNILTIPRVATLKETEEADVAHNKRVQRPHYVEEPIAELIGIQALQAENDLKRLLVLDLLENIQVFKGKDIDSLTYDELRHWTKWVSTVEHTLDKAKMSVVLGNSLLTQHNLEPFSQILTVSEDKKLFRSYLKELP